MKQRKTVGILVRGEPDLIASFDEVAAANSIGATEVLRTAMRAIVQYHRQNGRIPRDMEIRQKVFQQGEHIKEAV